MRQPEQQPQQNRQARFQPSTFDAKERTIDVCFTTGSKGKRGGFWSEPYYEELEVTDTSVRLDRLNAGAAVLNTHSQWDLRDQIGVVEKAWVKGGKGFATLRFSERAEVAGIVKDIESGIIRNISVGYLVHKYQDVTAENDKHKTYRAVDWEPCEVSFVPVPFDAGAQVRNRSKGEGSEPELFDVEIIETARAASSDEGEPEMTTKAKPAANTDTETPAAPAADNKADVAAARAEAVASERARAAGIQEVCRKLNLDAKLGDEHVAKDTTVDQFRAIAIEQKAIKDEATRTMTASPHVTVGDQDEHVVRARGMEAAVMNRFAPGTHKLDDNSKRFAGLTLVDIARRHLEAHGVRTEGMHRHEIAQRAMSFRAGSHSTSDFPYILANVANKSLLAGYQQLEARQTFLPLVKASYTPDFKQVSRVRRGEAPNLALVPEGAEVTYGTTGESREVYTLGTYGRIIGITMEAIVNDDLGAFTSLPRDMGMAAARLESDVVWSIFTANAAMGDGVTLFHSTHGNVGTTAVISITSIAEAEKKMMLQTGINALAPLNIMPKYLIVPAALKATADQFVSQSLLASEAAKVNPYSGKLTVIAEARLDATDASDWYLAADPADGIDIIETLRLEGTNGPVTSMQDGWTSNGVEVKVSHHFAAKALDWRGLVFNEGGS